MRGSRILGGQEVAQRGKATFRVRWYDSTWFALLMLAGMACAAAVLVKGVG